MPLVTLDIQETCIRLLAANHKRVSRWATSSLEPGLVKDGVITDPSRLADCIKALLKEQRLSSRSVAVSLSGVRYIPRVLDLPKLKKQFQRDAIRYEAERRMPVPLEELFLDWQKVGGNRSGERYLVVAVSRRSINSVVETMNQAGIKKFTLDFKPIALARAVRVSNSVILNAEQSNVDIVLVVDGVPEIIRSLPVEWDPEAAEDSLEEIGDAVIRTIEYHNSVHVDRPLDAEAPVFFTGYLAREPSAQKCIERHLGERLRPVHVQVDCPLDMPMEEYVGNVGMTLGRLTYKGRKESTPNPAMAIGASWNGYKPTQHLVRNLLAAGVVVLALASLLPLYEVTSRAQFETDLLLQELTYMEEQRRDAVKTNAALENLDLETASLLEERQTVLGQDARIVDMLKAVFPARQNDLTLDALVLTGDVLITEGTAGQLSQVIAFSAELENTGLFSTVNMESLSPTETDAGDGYTPFEIRAEY